MAVVMQRPTWEQTYDAGKFFIDVEDADGNVGKMMMKIIRAAVIVTSAFGDKVAFTKSNRGKTFLDSRMSQRKDKKDSWGEKTVVKERQRLNAVQLMEELERLLDDKYEAERAFYALQV
ncbi:unnamed protein product [Sphagnum jensenii]|uniref:Uncharacterized protein n=1 Tax=Sphagnum jensenii TaxID=128206 RepID=A0ABP0VA42_9BRYO